MSEILNNPINTVDRFGAVNRGDLDIRYKHGSTQEADVFKELTDLINVYIIKKEQNVDGLSFQLKPNIIGS